MISLGLDGKSCGDPDTSLSAGHRTLPSHTTQVTDAPHLGHFVIIFFFSSLSYSHRGNASIYLSRLVRYRGMLRKWSEHSSICDTTLPNVKTFIRICAISEYCSSAGRGAHRTQKGSSTKTGPGLGRLLPLPVSDTRAVGKKEHLLVQKADK